VLSFLPSHTAGLRFAIIENEFGDISVDDKVLQEACDEEVVEVCLNPGPWTQNPRP
jgi:G3E family GTPase